MNRAPPFEVLHPALVRMISKLGDATAQNCGAGGGA
jgi:hypothetical protein